LVVFLFRILGWSLAAILFVFLVNNYLVIWRDWPGIVAVFAQWQWFGKSAPGQALSAAELGLAWGQLAAYFAAIVGAFFYVSHSRDQSLRDDSERFAAMANYVIRAAFWTVLLVGAADALISFLRVEDLLSAVVGEEITTELGRAHYRWPVVHMPLLLASLVIAAFTRSLGFTWLALLVVVAELLIVFSRFVFSYEQAFMGDLVRFWYAALFLFASAYTLLEEGHVRVDVLYASFSRKTKGLINAVGSLVLGIALCSVILVLGMGGKANIINSPLLSIEVSQSGFGMYVKYLMAGFLAVFAVSMLIQFIGYMLSGIADFRGEPGGRDADADLIH